jgi:hypothetical protein
LTAAKLEAQMIDLTPERDRVENRRRKWDCFHMVTAMTLGRTNLYSTDEGMLAKQQRLSIRRIQFLAPLPQKLELFGEDLGVRIQ